MEKRGEITVFLTLVLVCVWALLCGLVESARTAGARVYLRQAMGSSMDSLFGQYHRKLWEQYRILGLEYGEPEDLESEFLGFLTPYLEAGNWYPLEVQEVQTAGLSALTDEGGGNLEQQILAYMKYGLAGALWDEMKPDEAEEMIRAIREAGTVKDVAGLYKAHAKEAVKLEKALENLDNCLLRQQKAWNAGAAKLAACDGGGFASEAGIMERELRKVPGLVRSYEERADRLNRKLEQSRKEFEAGKADLSPEVQRAFEAEILQYEAYTSEDGSRRLEIHAMAGASGKSLEYVAQVKQEAEAVQDYIDSWEPDDEDDELDEEALWSPVLASWNGCPVLSLEVKFGIADKEKEGFLERVQELMSGSLLELLLPEGERASEQKPDLTAAPSKRYLAGAGGGGKSSQGNGKTAPGPVDRLMIGEYALRYFSCYGRLPEKDGCCAYEAEYILCGHEADRENLEAVAVRLLAVREGLNLIHILSDPQKREEARNLAMAITGGVGLLPLSGVMAFFIMGVWALGEAILDVRVLLDGGGVPFLKTRTSWRLGLDGLLDMGKNGGQWTAGPGAQVDKKGMDYRGYLRLFLFFAWGRETDYRLMDMIQSNLRREQPDFQIDHCAHSVEIAAAVCGKHLFLTPGVWKAAAGGLEPLYEMRMTVSGSYE